MLNQVILVGRLVRNPEVRESETGKKVSIVTLAVNRPYKNIDGEYDTDFLDCTLWTAIAENTSEYCKKGDVIGIRGRLQTRIIDNEDGSKYKRVDVIADKVTFLSSAKNNNMDVIQEENNNLEEVNKDKKEEKKNNKKNK